MTAAAGLYNVVRQVFGSIGIAVAASQLTRAVTGYHAALAENVTLSRTPTTEWVQSVTAGMQGSGADPETARQMALALLDGEVSRQAGMMAYNHMYQLLTRSSGWRKEKTGNDTFGCDIARAELRDNPLFPALKTHDFSTKSHFNAILCLGGSLNGNNLSGT